MNMVERLKPIVEAWKPFGDWSLIKLWVNEKEEIPQRILMAFQNEHDPEEHLKVKLVRTGNRYQLLSRSLTHQSRITSITEVIGLR
jgi:hypothetical protein